MGFMIIFTEVAAGVAAGMGARVGVRQASAAANDWARQRREKMERAAQMREQRAREQHHGDVPKTAQRATSTPQSAPGATSGLRLATAWALDEQDIDDSQAYGTQQLQRGLHDNEYYHHGSHDTEAATNDNSKSKYYAEQHQSSMSPSSSFDLSRIEEEEAKLRARLAQLAALKAQKMQVRGRLAPAGHEDCLPDALDREMRSHTASSTRRARYDNEDPMLDVPRPDGDDSLSQHMLNHGHRMRQSNAEQQLTSSTSMSGSPARVPPSQGITTTAPAGSRKGPKMIANASKRPPWSNDFVEATSSSGETRSGGGESASSIVTPAKGRRGGNLLSLLKNKLTRKSPRDVASAPANNFVGGREDAREYDWRGESGHAARPPVQVQMQAQLQAQVQRVQNHNGAMRERPPSREHQQQQQQQQPASFWPGSTNQDDAQQPEENEPLFQCRDCGRRFAERALAVHERACRKVFQSKRKKFNSTAARVQGTEAAKYQKPSHGGPKTKANTINKPPSYDATPLPGSQKAEWKAQSEAFRSAIRNARKLTQQVAAGVNIRDIPRAPPTIDPSLIQCPCCGRRYNKQAAERHIPKCRDIIAKPSRLKAGEKTTGMHGVGSPVKRPVVFGR